MNEPIQIGPISPLRQRLIDDMTMRRFSKETQRNYLRDVGRFATWLGRSPHTASAEDIPGARNGSTPTPSSTQTAAADETDSAQFRSPKTCQPPTADDPARPHVVKKQPLPISADTAPLYAPHTPLHITLDGLV